MRNNNRKTPGDDEIKFEFVLPEMKQFSKKSGLDLDKEYDSLLKNDPSELKKSQKELLAYMSACSAVLPTSMLFTNPVKADLFKALVELTSNETLPRKSFIYSNCGSPTLFKMPQSPSGIPSDHEKNSEESGVLENQKAVDVIAETLESPRNQESDADEGNTSNCCIA
jgi:hypothetical protein